MNKASHFTYNKALKVAASPLDVFHQRICFANCMRCFSRPLARRYASKTRKKL